MAAHDDRDAVDRAFADLVASYHLTSDRPDPLLGFPPPPPPQAEVSGTAEAAPPDAAWADQHPLFRHSPVDEEESAEEAGARESVWRGSPEETADWEDQFVPEPPMPLPRPAWPVLVAWIAMGYAVLVVLAISLGGRLPAWAGWLGLVGFVGGFGLLLTRLPRHRPPDAGDGAVL